MAVINARIAKALLKPAKQFHNRQQFDDLLAGAGVKLDDTTLDRIDEIVASRFGP
jgi:hypothetical protein